MKKFHSVDVEVIESKKEFELIGRDMTRVDHIDNVSLSDVKVVLAVRGVKGTIKLKPDLKTCLLSRWESSTCHGSPGQE